jgi:hypothetical protein
VSEQVLARSDVAVAEATHAIAPKVMMTAAPKTHGPSRPAVLSRLKVMRPQIPECDGEAQAARWGLDVNS